MDQVTFYNHLILFRLLAAQNQISSTQSECQFYGIKPHMRPKKTMHLQIEFDNDESNPGT